MIVRQPDQKFPTSPEGTHAAICVDEIDMGKVQTKYNGQERERHMVRLVWLIDEVMPPSEAAKFNLPAGSCYIVKQDYTASLDEKAKLRKHLQAWRGRAFTQEELVGFDLENVVGHGCMLSIVHNTGSRGGVFANVEAVMKLPRGAQAPEAKGYVRIKDRKPQEPAQQNRARQAEQEPPDFGDSPAFDEDVPF